MAIKNKIFLGLLFVFSSCADFEAIFAPPRTSRETKVVKNTEVNSSVSSGTRLPIKTKKGTYHFAQPGDTLSGMAENYHIRQEELADINNIMEAKLVIGQRLFIPDKTLRKKYVTISNIAQEKRPRIAAKRLRFDWPVKDFVLTSPYGLRRGRPHDGVDLSARRGTPILAAEAGTVIYAKRFSSYGNLIVIKHAGNYFTAYAHTDSVFVGKGSRVKRGQKIATIGRTGRSSGPHLHFEMYKGTVAIDPVKVLPKKDFIAWKKR